MDLRALCLAAICVLFVNGDKTSSQTDFSPSTLNIACKQLIVSSCPEHGKWINRCPEEIHRTGSGKSLAKLYLAPETVYTGDLDLSQYNTSLHQACEEGKLDVVKYILSQGLEDINCRGKMGRTPVMMAAREGHVKVFEYLVSQGCDLSAVNEFNTNVIHYACMGGSIEIVRKLIVYDTCDIDSIGHRGRTPIMYATFYGHREAFDLLVEKGCDLLVTDELKNNILHLACEKGHVDMVQYILSHTSVNKESRGQSGRTPLLIAANYGRAKVFDDLLRNGCNVNAVDDDKNHILHLACRGGHVDMVQHILSHTSVSIESKGFNGMTPVLTAAWYGKTKIIDFLIKKACNVNAVDDDKYNILHAACLGRYVETVRHILSLKIVSIDSRGFAGMTPVLIAAWYGNTKMLDIIVEKGCNVNAVDNERDNILHLACRGGHVDMVQHILSDTSVGIESKGFNGMTPVLTAAWYGKTKILDFLIKKACNVNAVDDDKNHILHLACRGGHVDMVQHILSHTSVSIESKGFNGMTPVLTAAWYGKTKILDFLIKKACNVNAVDNNKNNVLHLACIKGHVDMVRLILSSSIVSIECRGRLGRVPLLLAAEFGNKRVFDFLIKKGAKIIAQDDNRNSILHVACLGGHTDMVKYLLSVRAVDGMEKLRNKWGRTPLQMAGRKVNK